MIVVTKPGCTETIVYNYEPVGSTRKKSLRTVAGALLYDARNFERHVRGRWPLIRNRNESIADDGRGVACEWRWTSNLHYCDVFTGAGRRLMRASLRDWPIVQAGEPASTGEPLVTFLIGHRGAARLPLLLATLRSIAGQDVPIECIVVEQATSLSKLPTWVRQIHQKVRSDDEPYNRSATFNLGVQHARARILVLHDNDMLVPAAYAREVVRNADEGWEVMDLKRFIFYLDAHGVIEHVTQNNHGGSVAVTREAYDAIGGFDEGFVGWGGEDNDFWERAETRRRTAFGYLPILHLWHAPQAARGGIQRYHDEIGNVSAEERIRRLRNR
jgi:hypothetical protein